MKQRNKIKIGILVVFVAIGLFIKQMIFVEKIDVAKKKPDASMTSKELLSSFISDETSANQLFSDKIVEVSGVVKEITFLNNRNTILLYSETFPSLRVICDMQDVEKQSVKNLKLGQEIKLKGICKGFLKDVVLLDCLLINL